MFFGSSEVDLNYIVFIIVFFVVVFFVIFGIGWWKRKEIKKWISDYISNFFYEILSIYKVYLF